MHLFGGPTPKRHLAVCNSRHIAELNQGPLRGWKKKLDQGGAEVVRLVRRYIDKKGKARWHGLPALRGSEWGS